MYIYSKNVVVNKMLVKQYKICSVQILRVTVTKHLYVWLKGIQEYIYKKDIMIYVM